MNANRFKFEVCANSVESCIAAQSGGADRVELCSGILEGGTTPSFGEIYAAREVLKTTKLHVIIRPRGGDFLYTPVELDIMLKDIETACRIGVDGIVLGCLTDNGDVDTVAMREMMKASRGLSVTFHRAFDVCRDPLKALNDIIDLGCDRILTSGQMPTAEYGISMLKELQRKSLGRIVIMAGCGVNENNIAHIAAETGICEFHFSARESFDSGMKYRNDKISMSASANIDEYARQVTTAEQVRRIIRSLTSI